MTAEAKAEFAGSGVSVKGSAGMHGTSNSEETLKQSIQSEVSSAASQGTTTIHHTTCTSKPGDPDTRTGLWQWVISSEDYSTSAFTPHTVCRTGAHAFEEPECSYWDCSNGDCTACKDKIDDKNNDAEEELELNFDILYDGSGDDDLPPNYSRLND